MDKRPVKASFVLHEIRLENHLPDYGICLFRYSFIYCPIGGFSGPVFWLVFYSDGRGVHRGVRGPVFALFVFLHISNR